LEEGGVSGGKEVTNPPKQQADNGELKISASRKAAKTPGFLWFNL
jgi:hypothetical protein